MGRTFHGGDHTWEVTVSRHEPHPGVTAIVFHCVTNSQEPYRVVEVPSGDLDAELSQFGDAELDALFARSEIMDYSHDPAAHPDRLDEPPPAA
jgi:hypothetical protein